MIDHLDSAPSTADLLKQHPGGIALIAGVLAIVTGAFAYTAGYIGPGGLSPARILDTMEQAAGGPSAGFRRAHAKGLCFTATFVGSRAGQALSTATVLNGVPVPVIGRFAQGNGDPHISDGIAAVRSMALQMQSQLGDEWRMAMNNTPGMPVSTVQAFQDNNVASLPDPKNGKPDPQKVTTFLARHPETIAFRARMKARVLASGFANDSYNSVHGFLFVGPDGKRRLARWSMVAEDAFATLSPEERDARAAQDPNYAFGDLARRITRGPVRWRMVATLAEPGDPSRAAEVWPDDRPKVVIGQLTVDRVESEAAGNCRDIVYDPLILPAGVAASDDPLLAARSATYAASFRRRAGEVKTPSVVSVKARKATP